MKDPQNNMFACTSDDGLWKKPLYVQIHHQSPDQKMSEDYKPPDHVGKPSSHLPTPILTVNSNSTEQFNDISKPRTNPISPFPTQSHPSPPLHHLLMPHKKHYQHNQQAESKSYDHDTVVDNKENKDNSITHDQQGKNGPLDLSTTKFSDLKYTSAKCHFPLHKQNLHSKENLKMNECEMSPEISSEVVDYATEREHFERKHGLHLLSNCAELMNYKQNDKLSTKNGNNQTLKTSFSNEENQKGIRKFISRKIKQYSRKRRKGTKKVMALFDTTSKAVKIKIKMIKLQKRYRKIKQKLNRLKSSDEVISQIEVFSHSQEDSNIKSKNRLNKLQDVNVSEPIYACASSGLSPPNPKDKKIQLRGPNVENPDSKSCDQCILTDGDLNEGLRVLLRLDGLFHPGILSCVLAPDIYGVLVERERGNKPHIMPREEVISQAIHDQRPDTVSELKVGARVCAFWSSMMNYLHPGTVVGPDIDKDYVIIQLDDGDCRDIHIEQVRYLPEHYPIQNTKQDKMPVKCKLKEKKDDIDENKSKLKSEVPQPPHPLVWSWSDEGQKIPSKAQKQYHDSIEKDEKTIHVGDCAVFLSPGQPDLPYIGQIDSMWQTPAGKMKVKIKWFYHQDEVEGAAVGGASNAGALFSSSHFDVNNVQTISHKCQVLEPDEYKQRLKTVGVRDLYWLAGEYDPHKRVIMHGKGMVT